MRYKLFCTVTMQSYDVVADSEYQEKKELANKLSVPISCIDVYR